MTTFTGTTVLDLAKTPRGTADQGKAIAVSTSDENALALTTGPGIDFADIADGVDRALNTSIENLALTPDGAWRALVNAFQSRRFLRQGYAVTIENPAIGQRKILIRQATETATPEIARDFDFTAANASPSGITTYEDAGSTYALVVDSEDDKIYAYQLGRSGATYVSIRDIDLRGSNGDPAGIGAYTDGGSTWVFVPERSGRSVFGYSVIGTEVFAGFTRAMANTNPTGIATYNDGTNDYALVVDGGANKVFAYQLGSNRRAAYVSSRDFNLASNNSNPTGITTYKDARETYALVMQGTGTITAFAYRLTSDGAEYDNLRNVEAEEDNANPSGITTYVDGKTTYALVADSADNKAYAYRLTAFRLDPGPVPSRGFDLAEANANSSGIATYVDGENAYALVVDSVDDKVYAYTLSDTGATYSNPRDFNLNTANSRPAGITTYTDGPNTYALVVDAGNGNIYAYQLSGAGGAYDSNRSFDSTTGNDNPTGIASFTSGGTSYALVVDSADRKAYAYILSASGGTYDSSRDVNLTSTNTLPVGITTYRTGGRVYALVPSSTGNVFAYLISDPGSPYASDRDFTPALANTHRAGITTYVGEETVYALLVDNVNHKVFAYAIDQGFPQVGPDPEPVTSQSFRLADLNDSPTGIATYAESGNTYALVVDSVDSKVFAYRVFSSGVAHFGARDFRLSGANSRARGITTYVDQDTTYALVVDSTKVHSYRLPVVGALSSSRDFDLSSRNAAAAGIATYTDVGGTFALVLDVTASKVFAYQLSSSGGTPAAARDFDLESANSSPSGITTYIDGGKTYALVLSSSGSPKAFAYELGSSGGTYVSVRDFNLTVGNNTPQGITAYTSGGTNTALVVDGRADRIYSYTIATPVTPSAGAGTAAFSFDLNSANGNPTGIAAFSIGSTTYVLVTDASDRRAYAYQLGSSGATYVSSRNFNFNSRNTNAQGVTVLGRSVRGNVIYYALVVDGTSVQRTPGGSNVLPVFSYRIFNSGGASYNAGTSFDLDENNLDAAGLAHYVRSFSNVYSLDSTDLKVYGYRAVSSGAFRDSARDFDLNTANANPVGIAIYTAGSTEYALVADSVDSKAYAYQLSASGGTYTSTRDLSFAAANTNPSRMTTYAVGSTNYALVLDGTGSKVYAYEL